MRNAVWAERLITPFVGQSRAASIVGDLLETEAQKGAFGFWSSVGRILLALLWRPTIAFVATFFVGLFWRLEFNFQNLLPYQPRPSIWYVIAGCLRLGIPAGNMSEPHFRAVWFGTVLWMAVSYTAIRYGLRDKLAQLALGLGGLVTIAVFFLRMPIVIIACVGLALALSVVSIRSAQWRRGVVALTAALILAFGCGLLSMYLKAALEYPLVRWDVSRRTVLFWFWLLAVWIATTAFASVHDHLLQHGDHSPEAETTSQTSG